MISVCLKDSYKNTWWVMLPYELNMEFFYKIEEYTRNNSIRYWYLNIKYNDFWADKEFQLDELDKLYNDLDVLEKNLDEIIKIIPLPKKIWVFDGYYREWFIFYRPSDLNKLKKYLDQYREWLYPKYEEEKLNIYKEWTKDFKKEDMLLIISLIKKKILEAKNKWETLVFVAE